MDQLQDIIGCVERGDSGVSSNGLYIPNSLERLDFQNRLKEAILEYRSNESILDSLEEFLSITGIDKIPLQMLISVCSNCLSGDVKNDKSFKSRLDERLNQLDANPRILHIVYTFDTTGKPKGCISLIQSFQHYLQVKNEVSSITEDSTVLLASALSFDPCLSDILATFQGKETLAMALRTALLSNLSTVIQSLHVTHVLCTPTLRSLVDTSQPKYFHHLRVVALGGEPFPRQIRQKWGRSHQTKGLRP
jgi:non-ribosomal peptide synthetase component F